MDKNCNYVQNDESRPDHHLATERDHPHMDKTIRWPLDECQLINVSPLPADTPKKQRKTKDPTHKVQVAKSGSAQHPLSEEDQQKHQQNRRTGFGKKRGTETFQLRKEGSRTKGAPEGLGRRCYKLSSGHAIIAPFLSGKWLWIDSDQRQSRSPLQRVHAVWKEVENCSWRVGQ